MEQGKGTLELYMFFKLSFEDATNSKSNFNSQRPWTVQFVKIFDPKYVTMEDAFLNPCSTIQFNICPRDVPRLGHHGLGGDDGADGDDFLLKSCIGRRALWLLAADSSSLLALFAVCLLEQRSHGHHFHCISPTQGRWRRINQSLQQRCVLF